MSDYGTDDAQDRSFGPHVGGEVGEYARLAELVRSDPEAAWRRIVQITAMTDDAGLYWVGDILEDFVAYHPSPYGARIEAELAINPRLRQAFLNFSIGGDDALADRLLTLREAIEREFGVD